VAHDSNNLRKWEYQNGLYQRALSRYLDRMAHHARTLAPRTVLDAGCGEGYVYAGLAQRGVNCEWAGVDASANAVEFAKEWHPQCEWSVGDLRAMPQRSASVDLVLCSQVLEHIPQPDLVRDELARVAARHLLISVPLEPVFRSICALTIAVGVGQDPGHVNFWTPRAFKRFLAPVGRLVHWEWTSVYQIAVVARR
jgi:2-polyprenyl-3-methyl-5-hydroxy-6-metoxy-1,4-benzoquinol methylase